MRKLGIVVGVLLFLAGCTFGLQGLGVLRGSAMTGKPVWAVIGPLLAVAGILLVQRSRRRPSS